MTIFAMISESVAAITFLFLYQVIDEIITNKRLKENQILWNEYSKNMTFNEKMDCYLYWCKQRKVEKGWRNYYFPKI